MEVCRASSSHSGTGVGDCISEISFPDPDGELSSRSSTLPLSGSSLRRFKLLSRSSTLPLSGSSLWRYKLLLSTSWTEEWSAGLASREDLGDPASLLMSLF